MDILKQIQDPTIYKINRLDAHSDHAFYEDENSMLCNDKTLHYSLNGIWQVCYSKTIAQRPKDFYKTNYATDDFKSILVPAHAELQGFGDIQYVNTQYPWDGKADILPPAIDESDSPVLSYVKYFDVPDNFVDRRICINFCGVEQAFSLYLNGEFVGYSQDSFTPSHFDLTPYIKKENNKLCVEVYKRTCFGWIEDQDFFRFSGIFRDVVLYAKPKVHVEDLFAVCEVDDALQSGKLTVKVKVSGIQKPNIEIEVQDIIKSTIYKSTPEFALKQEQTQEKAENKDEYYVAPTINVDNVALWDKNCPNIYTLLLRVYDESGNLTEIVKQDIGFRHFVLKGNVLYLNGKRLVLNGVNRHEWNAKKGRAIDAKDMLADIEVFKRNNIDSVRTSHYPNNSLWYELCDKNGITMMDEVNIESHGTWQKNNAIHITSNVPGSLKEWRDVTIDRAVSMFERDKNHVSILMWSCANESYTGENLLAMSNYFRRKDKNRYVHYEGCFNDMSYEAISDIESQMYTAPELCKQYLDNNPKKPFMLCEYMHNMGNSLGGFESYMELYKYPNYHGGYIWDYMDQALYKNINGKAQLCYGGDFSDRPTDYNFSGNGIVDANRVEKPAMQEVKYWYSSPEARQRHTNNNELLASTKANSYKNEANAYNNKSIQLIESNLHYGVKGDNFSILFSIVKGGPVSINYGGKEWLRNEMKPTYWRAPTENDIAAGFLQKSGSWAVADKYSACKNITAKMENGLAVIEYEYDTLQENSVFVKYTVHPSGKIDIIAKFNGKQHLPDLPLFGMQFATPEPINSFNYIGYSGETYPDRFKGGTFGAHNVLVNEQNFNYLVPQEYGCHSFSKCFTLIEQSGKRLSFSAKDSFHFSVLPHSSAELENAQHKYELAQPLYTYIKVLAKMRGVGGINTWGADVEKRYHISAKNDITLEFCIEGK